jgi:hypothetical protein
MPRLRVVPPGMAPSDEKTPRSFDDEVEAIHEVVPERAVLTELARGFLLVRENDRARAVRFARTFLRERSETQARPEPVAYPTAPPAQRSLGRFYRGAVERPDPRGPR